jgi:alpha-beta hydrolase superfamily lysophospholipase
MLRQLGRDPLVIKDTRVEAIYGLVNLMDSALQGFAKLKTRLLILYGEKDEVIPQLPVMQAFQMLPTGEAGQTVSLALYENGYHMLLRDLQRRIPLRDIADWIELPGQVLPSGADMRGLKALEKLVSEKRVEERL